jgi:PAS domain S-box-containing protein
MILIAQEGKIEFLNDKMVKAIGYSKEEILSKSFTDFIFEEDRKLVLDRHIRRMKGEDLPNVYSFRVIDKDGNFFWVEINTVLIEWKGKPSTLNFLRDITKRVEAQNAKRKSEEKYKKIFDNAGDAIFITDDKNMFVDVNNKAIEMLGYSKKELFKMTFFNLIFDQSKMDKMPIVLDHLNSMKPYYIEGKMYNKNKEIIQVQMTLVKISEDPTRFMSIVRNVTEIKKLKGEIKKLMKNKIHLTEKEAKVLYALVKDKNRSDQKIAEDIDIKRSTVTAIKNKFISENFFSNHIIPSPFMIGCKMLIVTHCRIKDSMLTKELLDNIKRPDSVVYVIATELDLIFLTLDDDFSKASFAANRYMDEFEQKGLIDFTKDYYFPLEKDGLLKFMQFSGVVKSALSLDEEDETFVFNHSERKLSKKDKSILLALSENPDMTDVEISEVSNTSRPKISSFKKDMIDNKFIFSGSIPGIDKLNINLVSLCLFNFKDKVSENARQLIKESENSIFAAANMKEIACISFCSDFEKYKLCYEDVTHELEKEIKSRTDEVIMKIDKILYFDVNFKELLKRKLSN